MLGNRRKEELLTGDFADLKNIVGAFSLLLEVMILKEQCSDETDLDNLFRQLRDQNPVQLVEDYLATQDNPSLMAAVQEHPELIWWLNALARYINLRCGTYRQFLWARNRYYASVRSRSARR